MSKPTAELIIGVMPEGPIAHDGNGYRYSKGERLYLDNLAKNFKRVVLITLVLRSGDEAYESCIHSPFEAPNIEIEELPRPRDSQLGVLGKAGHFFKVFLALISIVRSVDVLYVFLPSYPSAMGWLVAKLFRKIHIVYGADDWEQASQSMFKWNHLRNGLFYRVYAALNKWMEKRIVNSALFAVAAGGQLRQKYTNFGCPTYDTSPRMTLTRANIYERNDTCQGDEIVLINVGALIHDKALHILLDAFQMALLQHPKLKLKIVGQGPLLNELRDQAESLGVAEKVDFMGYIEKEEQLYDLLKQADVFVLSSVTEGFPRVLYESMSHRLPIVTTDVGGIPYLLIDDKNARVVTAGDSSALSSAITDMVSNDKKRQSIISRASETMEEVFDRLDPEQIAHLLDKHLKKTPGC
ncbi:MAG: glycosyltransferase [Hyphomicrobiales bacterium]